jgi:hypothetical protein
MTQWLVSQGRRWVLIFDNANSLKDIMPIVAPLTNSGHIILTTQDTRAGANEFVNKALEVRMLDPELSQQLLFHRAGVESPQPDEIEVAKALVEEIGYLPLAIDSAGAYINVRHKTVKEYSDLFHKHQKEMLDHRPDASSYVRSVRGTVELNFKDIDLKPGASALLSLLVFLDRSEVTEQFLRRGVTNQLRWGSRGEPVEVEPAQRYVPESLIRLINSDLEFDQAIEDLEALSIISCQKREGLGRCFTIHPLYHKCAKLRMTEEQRQRYGSEAALLLSHAFPSDEYSLESRLVLMPQHPWPAGEKPFSDSCHHTAVSGYLAGRTCRTSTTPSMSSRILRIICRFPSWTP